MGLVVMALVAAFVVYFRSIRAWLTGVPTPRLVARPGAKGALKRFVAGIGKARPNARRSGAATVSQVEEWRDASASHAQRLSATGALNTDCEVLVVGAGPNGLMLAALLVRRGIHVRIIDMNDGPAQESRAFAVQARTIELFRNLGLADQLLKRGVLNHGIKFHIKGKQVGGLDFDRAKAADTPYQFILMAPQNEVEEVLLGDLARHGVAVERNCELFVVQQTAVAVQTTVRCPSATKSITCRYIVGADGAHSKVRKAFGLTFQGGGYAQSYVLADCRVDWPFDHTQFRIFMNGERIGLFLPLKGRRMSRVMATDLSADPQSNSGHTTNTPLVLAELEASLSRAMCVPVKLSDAAWITRYRVHLRGTEHYRAGRGFVVGDAAHIHSPAGGQGMNTGFQDAANLAWKLALVLRTGASDALLDTYHGERHPIGVELLRFTDRLYKVAADLRGWVAWVRDIVGPFLLGRMAAAPISHRKSFRRLSQIGLRYPANDINVNGPLYSLKGPLAGERAPDARISSDRQLFDLLTGYRVHVMALSRKHLLAEEIAEWTGQLRSIASFGGGIATHLIGRVACRRDERVEYVDGAEVFERYGLTEEDSQALYVVRPDGHVGWRSDEMDFDACRTYLARIHGAFASYEAQRQLASTLAAAQATAQARHLSTTE